MSCSSQAQEDANLDAQIYWQNVPYIHTESARHYHDNPFKCGRSLHPLIMKCDSALNEPIGDGVNEQIVSHTATTCIIAVCHSETNIGSGPFFGYLHRHVQWSSALRLNRDSFRKITCLQCVTFQAALGY